MKGLLHTPYRRSVFYIISGGALLSTLGVGTRLMDEAEGLEVTFYRSVGVLLFACLMILRERGRNFLPPFTSIGVRGLLISLFMAGGSLFMILAMMNTTVANAVFFLSMGPFVTAIMAWIFLREPVPSFTKLAILIGIFGVCIMVWGEISGDGLVGMAFAGLMVICTSAMTTMRRYAPHIDQSAPIALSALILILLFLPFVGGMGATPKDIILCILLGMFQFGSGIYLILLGTRHVPAAQVAILALLEVVLSPIWVWVWVGETPALTTLLGGGWIFLAVGWQLYGQSREAPPSKPKSRVT